MGGGGAVGGQVSSEKQLQMILEPNQQAVSNSVLDVSLKSLSTRDENSSVCKQRRS